MRRNGSQRVVMQWGAGKPPGGVQICRDVALRDGGSGGGFGDPSGISNLWFCDPYRKG